MLYTTMTVKEKELKLRLKANMTVQVEKQIGRNPINALIGIGNGEIPKLNDLLIMLWGALQPLNRGYTINKVWDLYDDFVSEGKSINDLIEIIMEVLKVSGFIKEEEIDEEDDSEEKNG